MKIQVPIEFRVDESGRPIAVVTKDILAAGQAAASTGKNMSSSLGTATARAGEFADNIGRVSTTLARSADAFGLPVGPLRALDDVMDVAELGMKNLAGAAAGFNAASVGVVGAGLAIGTAIGSWLRTFPAVEKAADSLGASLYKLFAGPQGAIKQNFLGGEMAKIQESYIRTQTASIEQQHKAGKSAEELARKYASAPPEIQKLIKSLEQQDAAHKQATAAMEAAKKAVDDYIAALPGGSDEAARIDTITAAIQRLGTSATQAQLTKIAQDLKEIGVSAKDEVTVTASAPKIPLIGQDRIATAISDTSMLNTLVNDLGHSYDEAGRAIGRLPTETEEVTTATFNWHDALENVANTFMTLAATNGPLSGILSMLGQAANMAASVGAGLDSISKGRSQGGISGFLGAAAGGLGIVGSVIGFIGGIFGGGKKKAEELKKKQEEAMQSFASLFDEWKQARSELAGKGADAINGLIDSLFGEDGAFVEGLTSASNAAEYVAASFAMLRASGMSTAQALERLKPALDKIRSDPAFAGGAADPLISMANAAETHAAALDFVANLGVMANALAGFGLLTQDLATKMSLDMGGAIQKMIDAGVPYEQALALNAQALYDLQQAAQQSGVALDGHTQQLIDDAENAGLFEGLEDPMKKLVELNGAMVAAMGELVKLLGGSVPAAIQKMIDEFNQAAANMPRPGSTPVAGDTPDNGPAIPGGGNDFPQARVTAASGYGPKLLRQDTIFQAHAGEHVLIVPKGQPVGFVSAAKGYREDRERERGGGGGGGNFPGPSPTPTPVPTPTPSPSQTAEVQETRRAVQRVERAVEEIARAPRAQVAVAPQVTVQMDPSLIRRDRQQFFADAEEAIAAGIRQGTSPVLYELRQKGIAG